MDECLSTGCVVHMDLYIARTAKTYVSEHYQL